jgi:hypothetical protein
MSDNNELDPQIESSLRDLPAADQAMKEAHIAAALGEVTPAQSGGRLRFLSVAAAVLILVAGVITVSKNSNDTPPAIAADTTATSAPKASAECEHSGGFWGDVGGIDNFTLRGTKFELVHRDDLVDLYFGSAPCTMLGTISYSEALVARVKATDAPNDFTECSFASEPLVRFSDEPSGGGDTYSFVLVATEDGVSLYFEDRCNEPIGSIPLPTSGD